jgi:deazaflavin-dependent oxidoreductase (nitroreductase family)
VVPKLTLPRSLARFNKRVTNRIQGTWAWLVPPYAVVVHRGRRSGNTYRTPVMASVAGDDIAIGVLYGPRSDWVRNLLTDGRGEIVRCGRTYELLDPKLVDVTENRDAALGPSARALGSVSGKLLVARRGARVAARTRRGFPDRAAATGR